MHFANENVQPLYYKHTPSIQKITKETDLVLDPIVNIPVYAFLLRLKTLLHNSHFNSPHNSILHTDLIVLRLQLKQNTLVQTISCS
jgi:hypothetical protein